MSSERLQALEDAYERLTAISLNQAPIDGIEDLVDPDVMGYGTTIDERVFDLQGFIKLVRNQEDQAKAAGLETTFDKEEIYRRISPELDMGLFVDQITVKIKSEEIFNQFMFRMSVLMEKQQNGWKLVHWHGSIPSDTENDTWHINEWKAEKEKLEQLVEERTRELRDTQEQLIQQEKLASLGQLTAGIAHEIKNPLNFVTNFSDLNIELLDEIRSQLQGAENLEDSNIDNELILDVLNDVEANLKKIHEHGSRADRIVKSMLQHSRGSDGVKEPTDLNSLIKEYVTLSFHGMRAGDKPINVDLDFELDESIETISLITEDFTRVIVNLCNNAFDAMRDKETADASLETGEDYQPKLTVRTHQESSTVTIEIEDNGPGIPKEMKDKILQPFFTTKKGTQGTGLGLSISNDIVKAHGGNMTIETSTGEGTVFKISLPS